jgi:hypothetical protein
MKWLFIALAGAGAYAAYKYSKMSEQQKQDLSKNLKEKGKKLYDEYVPGNMKNMFAGNQ